MKVIRNFLERILGLQAYLSVVSAIYIRATAWGFWKKKYPELFYLYSILKPGDTCIDIGANLGYYSWHMSKIVGNSGKVYAVEPIPMFGAIWKKNLLPHNNPQVELFPYALGAQKSVVQMGIPLKNGRIHHGMTKIASTAEELYVQYFDVEMQNPDELFSHITKLDFVKCDVEGYESEVFTHFTQIIKRFKPLIQSELGGDVNRKKVIELLTSLGYSCSILKNNTLQPVSLDKAMLLSQDFYFVPNSH